MASCGVWAVFAGSQRSCCIAGMNEARSVALKPRLPWVAVNVLSISLELGDVGRSGP